MAKKSVTAPMHSIIPIIFSNDCFLAFLEFIAVHTFLFYEMYFFPLANVYVGAFVRNTIWIIKFLYESTILLCKLISDMMLLSMHIQTLETRCKITYWCDPTCLAWMKKASFLLLVRLLKPSLMRRQRATLNSVFGSCVPRLWLMHDLNGRMHYIL